MREYLMVVHRSTELLSSTLRRKTSRQIAMGTVRKNPDYVRGRFRRRVLIPGTVGGNLLHATNTSGATEHSLVSERSDRSSFKATCPARVLISKADWPLLCVTTSKQRQSALPRLTRPGSPLYPSVWNCCPQSILSSIGKPRQDHARHFSRIFQYQVSSSTACGFAPDHHYRNVRVRTSCEYLEATK